MQRPSTHAIVTSRPVQQWAGGAAFVAALHIALIYALISGLAIPIVRMLPSVRVARILTQPPLPVRLPPPPPSQVELPPIDTVPPPIVTIEEPQTHSTITVRTSTQTEPPSSTSAIEPEAARAVTGTHTTPDYPVLSRRLGEQGTVLLRIAIADNGQIENVNIVHSSGYSRLDEAAREWVMRYWRYLPATRDGKSVQSTADASVVFNLKTATQAR